jgi:hypothetical protein
MLFNGEADLLFLSCPHKRDAQLHIRFSLAVTKYFGPSSDIHLSNNTYIRICICIYVYNLFRNV